MRLVKESCVHKMRTQPLVTWNRLSPAPSGNPAAPPWASLEVAVTTTLEPVCQDRKLIIFCIRCVREIKLQSRQYVPPVWARAWPAAGAGKTGAEGARGEEARPNRGRRPGRGPATGPGPGGCRPLGGEAGAPDPAPVPGDSPRGLGAAVGGGLPGPLPPGISGPGPGPTWATATRWPRGGRGLTLVAGHAGCPCVRASAGQGGPDGPAFTYPRAAVSPGRPGPADGLGVLSAPGRFFRNRGSPVALRGRTVGAPWPWAHAGGGLPVAGVGRCPALVLSAALCDSAFVGCRADAFPPHSLDFMENALCKKSPGFPGAPF